MKDVLVKIVKTMVATVAVTILAFLLQYAIYQNKEFFMTYDNVTETLIQVNEITRHGARAPFMAYEDFPVTTEQLTPIGMRQKYLLGRYTYTQYCKKLNKCKVDLKDGQVIMDNQLIQNSSSLSTNYYRTIMSSWAEHSGLTYNAPRFTLTDK